LLLPYLPSTIWFPLRKIQFAGRGLYRTLLGVLANLWKARIRCISKLQKVTVSIVMSICLHGTNQLPLDGFSGNLIFEHFFKICWENLNFINIGQERKTYEYFWSYLAHFLLEEKSFR
jgi:hypothetical protein